MTSQEKALGDFAKFAAKLKGDEKSEAQTFLFHLLAAFGHDANTLPEGCTFEYRVRFPGERTKFADLVWAVRTTHAVERSGDGGTTWAPVNPAPAQTIPWRDVAVARRPGQEATVEVDTYPDVEFHAKVESLSPGTGLTFSLLPAENATGNWVKVVQRLPVRLELDEVDPNRPLFSGMSVTARVDTGHRRTWRHPLQLVPATEAAK